MDKVAIAALALAQNSSGGGGTVDPAIIAETTEEWLEENIDPSTGYVVDKSLSVENAAADSKKVGDELADLKSHITNPMHWLGVTTTALTDGATTNPITIDGNSVTSVSGDVAQYNGGSFAFNGAVWQRYSSAAQRGTITLSTTWTGAGPYTQTVTVTGASVTANSKVDLQPTAAQIEQLIADGVAALLITNNDGVLTATAVGAAISTSMVVQCTVMEVA